MTKLFLTGATGYIGGHILYRLIENHPEIDICILVRKEEDAKIIQSAYPKAKLQAVIGSFTSHDVIVKAAKVSDIVIHTNADHMPAIQSILTGLNQRSSGSFLIHTSGTGIIADETPGSFGEPPKKVWSDIDDLATITSLPDESMHRDVDKVVLAAHSDKITTAIVCPPDIYGVSKSTHNKQSYLIPLYVEMIRKTGVPFVTEHGLNEKSLSHMDEVAAVYVRLVEEALKGGGVASWGAEGYYFTATSKMQWLALAEHIVKLSKKKNWLSENVEIQNYDTKKMFEVSHGARWGPYMWGSNALSQADRAKKLFGYKPFAPSVWDVCEEDMDVAYKEDRTEVMTKRSALEPDSKP